MLIRPWRRYHRPNQNQVDSTENTDQIAGEATGTDNANNNTLIITGKGEINGSYDISTSISNGRAYGGKAENGDASGNKVIIEQGGKDYWLLCRQWCFSVAMLPIPATPTTILLSSIKA